MIGKSHKLALCHRDRWQVEDMLREQPDLLRKDPERDMDLWRHLFAPDDLVRVGNACRTACESRCGGMVLGEYLERRVGCGDDSSMLARLGSPPRGDLQGADEPSRGLRSRARQAAS